MADFRPADVYAITQPGNTYPATLVGTQPIWSDDDDFSYASLTPASTSGAGISQARANYPDGTFAAVATAAATVWLRVKAANLALAAGRGTIALSDNVNFLIADQGITLVEGWNDLGPFTDAFEGNNGSLLKFGSLQQLLTAPGLFFFVNGASDAGSFDILEAMVRVEGGAPAPYVPPARATPSLRMLQRGGQGGMSGIPRMIGNPVRGLRQGPGSVY